MLDLYRDLDDCIVAIQDCCYNTSNTAIIINISSIIILKGSVLSW